MGTSENFGTYPHQRIWDEVHGGAGVNGQSRSQWGWYLLAGRLENVRAYVDKAVSGVAASREGAAADAATAAMTPLGAWVDEARRLAHETATAIADQTTSFSTAQASIPEVVQVPPESGWREWAVVDWATTSDHEQVQSQATEQERIAREVMNGYQNESNGRLAVLPQFAPPVPSEGSLGTGGGARPNVGSDGGGGGSTAGAGGELGSVGVSARSGGAPVTSFTGVASAGPGGVGDQAPAATAGQGFVPAGGAPGDQVGARPGAGGPSAPGTPGFTGATAGMPGAGGRHAGSGGSGGGSGGRIGGTGRFGGGGGAGFGPAGGGGPRGFGPGGMGPGGVGPGGMGPGQAGTASAASGPGRGGVGVGPMMGMGAAGGDRDRERPSWLQEQDPDAIVGDLPRTVPPVIGDDPPVIGGNPPEADR